MANTTVVSTNKQDYILRNNVDNNNMEDECELKTSKPNSKTKKDPTSSNILDNETIEHEFEQQNGKYESKNRKYYTLKDNVGNNCILQHTNCHKKIKVAHKTGESNNIKDRIQLDMKRNSKEKNENGKTNDGNNINVDTEIRYDSINNYTNQNNNDNYDSDKEIFLNCNHDINRCKDDKDNNTQNKEQYNEQSI